ncbi:hypothetical protein [Oceanobacillus salinisoli]|uniref:hypothetical protein n=1 Tax=Oceanobacillus salinisoli TaxID=2678611 RepID=UPI0012E1AFF1|nr:hypothetical protein [Oceanobacillus salinisoli]
MELKERIVFIIGLFIALFGFFIGAIFTVAVTMTDYSLPEESLITDMTIGLILGLVPLLFGIFICARMIKKRKQREEDLLENEILKLAANSKGKITTAELAANTNLSILDAERKLEYYVKIGVAERHISDGGVFVYSFRSVISEEEKHRSKNINKY